VPRQQVGPAQELVQEVVLEPELVQLLGAEDVGGQGGVGDDDGLRRRTTRHRKKEV